MDIAFFLVFQCFLIFSFFLGRSDRSDSCSISQVLHTFHYYFVTGFQAFGYVVILAVVQLKHLNFRILQAGASLLWHRSGRNHCLRRRGKRYGDASVCRNRRGHGKCGSGGKGDRGLCDGQRRRGRDHPCAPALQVDLEKENAPAARCGSRSNFYNSKKDTYGTFIFKRANSYRRCFQNFLQSQNQPSRYPMGKRK